MLRDYDNFSIDIIMIELNVDDDGLVELVGVDCKICEKLLDVNNKSVKLWSLKWGERVVVELIDCVGVSEDSRKKRKVSGNLGEFLS